MAKNKKSKSFLTELYYSVLEEKRQHFKENWFKYFGQSESTFNRRLGFEETPDLALFEFSCSVKVFSTNRMQERMNFTEKGLKPFELSPEETNQIEYENFL